MKKLMILSIMISLFAFWGSKNEVKTVHGEEGVSESKKYAKFYQTSIYRSLQEYMENIVSIKVSNDATDVPPEDSLAFPRIQIWKSMYVDENGNESTPPEGAIFAYLSEAASSTETDKRYDCVLYADADKIYASENASRMFMHFSNASQMDLSMLDTSKTTDMSEMFNGCTSLSKLDLSNFNTSNVIKMMNMFQNCYSLTELNLSSFNTSNVVYMNNMFHNCSALAKLDISNFDTSNVINMEAMFCLCSSLTEINVSNFNTSNVTKMNGMFSGCSSLTSLNLSNFDTSNVTTMSAMFRNCSSLTEINVSSFNTINVGGAYGMFSGCSKLEKLDVSSFDMSNVIDPMDTFISNCDNLEYIKSPSSLPAESVTNSSLAIALPTQFSPYLGITELTAANLEDNKVINLLASKFIYEWEELRTEGGDNGVCAAIPSTSTGNAKLLRLLNEYDALDTETKKSVDKAIDKENVTVGESVAYVKNVLNGSQSTEGDYGISKENSCPFMTMRITEGSSYLIALISLLGVLSIVGYYLYNKKKQSN